MENSSKISYFLNANQTTFTKTYVANYISFNFYYYHIENFLIIIKNITKIKINKKKRKVFYLFKPILLQ